MTTISDAARPLDKITRITPTLSLPATAPLDHAPCTEPPVLAHTLAALRPHRGGRERPGE